MSISVGIPAYNHEGTIRDAVESLLNQTWPPDEIVVSDDHSTDHTRAILAEYEDQIRVATPEQHLGMAANYTFVGTMLSSDFIVLMSSDDMAMPHFIETLSRGRSICNDAVLIWTPVERIDMDGKFLRLDPADCGSQPEVARPPSTYLQTVPGLRMNINASAIRRTAFEKCGGFHHDIWGDWELLFRLAGLGPFVCVPKPSLHYRTYPRSGAETLTRLQAALDASTIIGGRCIPEVAATLPSRDRRRLLAASRSMFEIRLAHSCDQESVDRGEIVDQMEEWARVVRGGRLLERFGRGRPIRYPGRWVHPPGRWISSAMRRLRGSKNRLRKLRGSADRWEGW